MLNEKEQQEAQRRVFASAGNAVLNETEQEVLRRGVCPTCSFKSIQDITGLASQVVEEEGLSPDFDKMRFYKCSNCGAQFIGHQPVEPEPGVVPNSLDDRTMRALFQALRDVEATIATLREVLNRIQRGEL
jgi:hypothetical protein